jgi:hypothetical protein
LVTSSQRNFFIARDNGTLFEIDACGRGIAQFPSAQPGESDPDPWDVAVAHDGSLWIARYLLPSALVLNAAGAVEGTVDLSSFNAAGATSPNASAVRIVATSSGEKAFFALERLTASDAALLPGMMAVVDTATRTIDRPITMAGLNPLALTTQAMDANGGIFFADAGDWTSVTQTDAGIERFDTSTLTSSLLFDKPALGGTPSMVSVDAGCGAAIVADATPNVNRTSLVVFATGGGAVTTVFGPTPGFDLRGLLWTQGELLVGDAQMMGGGTYAVHVFTRGPNCTLSRAPDLFVPSLPPLAFTLGSSSP